MTDITAQRTVGDIVADNPAAARLFERIGVDYCCRGDRPLAAACTEAGVDPEQVAAELDALPVSGDRSWSSLSPVDLAAHIVEVHHRYLREELPLLEELAAKVAGVHGANHPELYEVKALVAAVRADLEPHLDKEERILFPAISAAANGIRDFPFGTIGNPIRVMSAEHDSAGDLLAALRSTTDGFAVPEDGCASYRSLYERLEQLELDTHLHIHKENHALFPAALALVGD